MTSAVVKGFDISSNNHNGEPFNFLLAKEAGYDFVYVKATQGNNYLNPYLIADCRDAMNNGLYVGVYHFYDAVNGTPEEQAQQFLVNGIAQVKQYTDLLPVLDYETVMSAAFRDAFLTALDQPAGVYMDRNYQENIGYGPLAKFGWLAWPDWSGSPAVPLPVNTTVLQVQQLVVPGIGTGESNTRPTDIDSCFDMNSILVSPQPEEEEMKLYYCTDTAGTGYVITPDLQHKKGVSTGEDAAALLATGQYVEVKLSDAQIAEIPG